MRFFEINAVEKSRSGKGGRKTHLVACTIISKTCTFLLSSFNSPVSHKTLKVRISHGMCDFVRSEVLCSNLIEPAIGG